MSIVLYDARWIGPHGIGRFADELKRRIPSLVPYDLPRRPWHPFDPFLLSSSLSREKPTLFFSPGYNSPAPYNGAFIFTLHDLNHLCIRENSSAAKRAYYKYFIRPACHRAVFVLTVSEYSKREISAWAGVSEGKIINVGAGVGHPFEPAGIVHEPGYPYLLYVGSHKSHKNLPRLLTSYAKSSIRKDVRLIISGSPDSRLASLVAKLGLKEAVTFAESASNDEIAKLYRGALAFVFPSLYEGFGLPPLEAMACGTPVLASNSTAMPEILGDAAVLVEPSDVDAIANGMERIVQDSELRSQLRQKGFVRAAAFTWEETARKTNRVLAIALEAKRP